MQKTRAVGEDVVKSISANVRQKLSSRPYYVFLLGPEFRTNRPLNADDAGRVGGYKRSVIRRNLQAEGYEVLTGEDLQSMSSDPPSNVDEALTAFAAEHAALNVAPAIIIIPTAEGPCIELGQIAPNRGICARTLVLSLMEYAQSYSGDAIETLKTLGGTVFTCSSEEMRDCHGTDTAVQFAKDMQSAHILENGMLRNPDA